MNPSAKPSIQAMVGELVVPFAMMLFVGAYWLDAFRLSDKALAFPAALTAIIVVTSGLVIAKAWISLRHPGNKDGLATKTDNVDRSLLVKTWMIVLLPIPAIYIWRHVGAIPIFFIYVLCIIYLLGERRSILLVSIPSFLSVTLVFLFKNILHVRLPDIPWSLGG